MVVTQKAQRTKEKQWEFESFRGNQRKGKNLSGGESLEWDKNQWRAPPASRSPQRRIHLQRFVANKMLVGRITAALVLLSKSYLWVLCCLHWQRRNKGVWKIVFWNAVYANYQHPCNYYYSSTGTKKILKDGDSKDENGSTLMTALPISGLAKRSQVLVMLHPAFSLGPMLHPAFSPRSH